jgi:hypothetical protein
VDLHYETAQIEVRASNEPAERYTLVGVVKLVFAFHLATSLATPLAVMM